MRVDFSANVRETLAKRAAFRCSFPGCGRLTIGPGNEFDSIESTGRACHIYSAAEKGPRGRGGLSEAEIESSRNGIWMCAHHADVIDKNRGVDYPPQLLMTWRYLHEHSTARDHRGVSSPFGWVKDITIKSSPLFKDGEVFNFPKCTAIIGRNGSGKTALCEWLSALSRPAPYAPSSRITKCGR